MMLLWMEVHPHKAFPPVSKDEEVELVLQLCCGQLGLPYHNQYRHFCLQRQSLLIPPYYDLKNGYFQSIKYKTICFMSVLKKCDAGFDR